MNFISLILGRKGYERYQGNRLLADPLKQRSLKIILGILSGLFVLWTLWCIFRVFNDR
jgi:hypothetical protein